MTAPQETQLSALIDGELPSHNTVSLYAALGRDPGLCATWERYHLIRQVLRGEQVRREVRVVAAAVWARTGAVPIGSRRHAATVLWRTPLVGAALAATAAFLVVFAVPDQYREAQPTQVASPQLVQMMPRLPPAVRRWDTDRSDLVSKLDRFLVYHQEAASASRAKGILPYATLVGYEAGR